MTRHVPENRTVAHESTELIARIKYADPSHADLATALQESRQRSEAFIEKFRMTQARMRDADIKERAQQILSAPSVDQTPHTAVIQAAREIDKENRKVIEALKKEANERERVILEAHSQARGRNADSKEVSNERNSSYLER